MPPAYCNPSFYIFREAAQRKKQGEGAVSVKSGKTGKSRKSRKHAEEDEDETIPKLKRDFEKFHSQNGVRTVIGSIGPVENGASYH